MVGLKINNIKGVRTNEFDEYTIHITLKEISSEGLELFGLDDDNIK